MKNASLTWETILERVRDLLNKSEQEKPLRLKEDLWEAQQSLIELRDSLIHEQRREASKEKKTRLDKINVVLSLITGVEYPTGGIERSKIKEAGKIISEIITNNTFS